MTEDRLARRAALLFAAALVVLGLGGLAYVLIWGESSDSPTQVAPLTDGIGPLPGADIRSYAKARDEALDRARGERFAIVSLDDYAAEAKARAAVGPLTVTALLAAPPGGTPSAVTGSLVQWADAQTSANREERDELLKLLPTVDDPQFSEFYRSEIDRLTKVIDAVNPNGPLVFAVVVQAPSDALRRLSDQAGVRLVDVGPEPELPAGAPVRGLRPEEKSTADDPPTRPV